MILNGIEDGSERFLYVFYIDKEKEKRFWTMRSPALCHSNFDMDVPEADFAEMQFKSSREDKKLGWGETLRILQVFSALTDYEKHQEKFTT